MYLELADNGITSKNTANITPLTPGNSSPLMPVAAPNGEIILMDATAFNLLDPVEASEALEMMPTLVGAMQTASGVPADEQVSAAEIISAALESQMTNQPRWSGSFNIEPAAKPWFARPEVLIPGAIVLIGSVYFLSRRK
jgi:hypothetical protein